MASNAELPAVSSQDVDFSLTRGGPYYRIARAFGLIRHDRFDVQRQTFAIVIVGWLPLELLVTFIGRIPGEHELFWSSLSIHARFLVAVPFTLLAERLLEDRCRDVMRVVRWHDLVQGPSDVVAGLARKAERLRDSTLAELLLVPVVFAIPLLSLYFTGRVAVFSDLATPSRLSPAMLWYALVSLPLIDFLVLRWLWRWLIWTLLLWRVSRLKLELIPTHPDHAGGIAHLSDPVRAIAPLLAGISFVLVASWCGRVVFADANPRTFLVPFAMLLVAGEALAFAPVMAFTGQMWRSRLRGSHDYSGYADKYVRTFHARWIGHPEQDAMLSGADVSGLADLSATYENLRQMRPTPFSREDELIVLAAMILPVLPLPALATSFKLQGALEGLLDALLPGG